MTLWAFRLAWLIPVGPLAAFVLIGLGSHRTRSLSQGLAVTGIVIALILSLGVFWGTVRAPMVHESLSVAWFDIGSEQMRIGVAIDPTSAVMLAMITVVGLMMVVYSSGYMRADRRRPHFFAYLSLLTGAMLGAVVCNNLLALFLFWEIMGVCSYLLIGYSWEKMAVRHAALPAFLVTRVGDLFMMLGLALLYAQVGSLAYSQVLSAPVVARLAETPYVGSLSVATVAVVLLSGGILGKIAQGLLYVWLPGPMMAPSPVSALLHATMLVSAGGYVLIRAFPLLAASQAMPVLALVGSLTAVCASIVALAQRDLIRVLAFSTLSQLGILIAALGIGAYAASLFHLITHAFFNALLFLAAGSVIQGLERGHQHISGHAVLVARTLEPINAHDMFNMGGLAFRMPLTALTFLVGSLALSGLPLVTAGFWSRDEVLAHAWGQQPSVFWTLALAACLTAFYAARQVSLVFLGRSRSRAATYARESAPVMTMPMVVLALFAISLGWVGIPHRFPVLGPLVGNGFTPFVEASLVEGGREVVPGVLAWQPLMWGVLLPVGGLVAGWGIYGRKPVQMRGDEMVDPLRLPALLRQPLRIDAICHALVVRPVVGLAEACYRFDRAGLDALLMAFARGLAGEGPGAPAAAQPDSRIFDAVVNGVGMLTCLVSRAAVALDVALILLVVAILVLLRRV